MELTKAVTGVALDKKQARVAILEVSDKPGIASKLFKTLADNNISVDMIIQSVARGGRNEIAFTVSKDSVTDAKQVCDELLPELEAKEVVIDEDIAKVSIVGAGMLNRPGIASDFFVALSDAGINIQMISTSEIKISCIIDPADAQKAVQVIHSKFGLEESNEAVIA